MASSRVQQSDLVASIRRGQSLILLTSALLLVFSFAPNDSATYELALEEIRTLRSVDWSQFLLEHYCDTMTRIDTRETISYLREVEAEIPISDTLRVNFPLVVRWPSYSDKVSEVLSYCETPLEFSIVARFDDIGRLWMMARKSGGVPFPNDATLTRVVYNLAADPDLLLNLETNPIPGHKFIGAAGYRAQVFRHLGVVPDSAECLFWIERRNPQGWRGVGRVARAQVIQAHTSWAPPEKWLRMQPSYKSLFSSGKVDSAFVPGLHSVFELIEGLSLAEASSVLFQKKESAVRSWSIAGISIDQRIFVWMGPIALAILMLVTLLPLRELCKDVSSGKPVKEADAWSGLFEGSFSKTLTLATLCSLPVLSSAVVLIVATDVPRSTFLILGMIVYLSLWIGMKLLELWKIR